VHLRPPAVPGVRDRRATLTVPALDEQPGMNVSFATTHADEEP
jgi:hypothetical protein